jgi:hypothetical protein
MPKRLTFPFVYDDAKTIDITKLKKSGYLSVPYTNGIIYWANMHGERTASISISVFMGEHPYIELAYTHGGKSIKYDVKLVSKSSNLGHGQYLYFECPHTKKLCRKLYSSNGMFLHREASKGMYECQKWSKYSRSLIALCKIGMSEDVEMKPYFKPTYRGKPTKRYLRERKKYDDYSRKEPHLIDADKRIKYLIG